jgi:hypothetical protein
MGRAALGPAARDKVVAIRVTAQEKKTLEALHGNIGQWMRRVIDAELRKELQK